MAPRKRDTALPENAVPEIPRQGRITSSQEPQGFGDNAPKAGDRVSYTMQLACGAENHSFESTPRNIITTEDAMQVSMISGESDTWIARIPGSMNTDKMNILSIQMEAVTLDPKKLGKGIDRHYDP